MKIKTDQNSDALLSETGIIYLKEPRDSADQLHGTLRNLVLILFSCVTILCELTSNALEKSRHYPIW
ncbi:hypothetical protein ACM41_05350 [Bradyrhizobium sp. CCBAU 21362]|nr:hypothetical protein [Bradyrhizobium sp. CCBAU 21362]